MKDLSELIEMTARLHGIKSTYGKVMASKNAAEKQSAVVRALNDTANTLSNDIAKWCEQNIDILITASDAMQKEGSTQSEV